MRKAIVPPLVVVLKRRRKAEKRRRRSAENARHFVRKRTRTLASVAGRTKRPAVLLVAPQVFTLVSSREHEVVSRFLRELVRATLVESSTVCIDFRNTEKFIADGTLLLFAEVQRILRRAPNSIRCIPPRDKVARQVMYHLELLSQFGCNDCYPSDRDDVRQWVVCSGVLADATQGLGDEIERLDGLTNVRASALFRSVTEALVNVTQHAYTQPRMDGTGEDDERGWWMFIRPEPHQLSISFCDLGIGVPHTVPNSPKHAGWLASRMATVARAIGVRSHSDAELIRVTVDEKRSRLRLEHRGNGFANMLEAINAAGNGQLMITSNRGAYMYKLNGAAEETKSQNYRSSIYGTVISWQFSGIGGTT